MLQVWSGSRMAFELAVPKALHGSLVEDGYFSSGPAWSPDEAVVAYTAEVGLEEGVVQGRGRAEACMRQEGYALGRGGQAGGGGMHEAA